MFCSSSSESLLYSSSSRLRRQPIPTRGEGGTSDDGSGQEGGSDIEIPQRLTVANRPLKRNRPIQAVGKLAETAPNESSRSLEFGTGGKHLGCDVPNGLLRHPVRGVSVNVFGVIWTISRILEWPSSSITVRVRQTPLTVSLVRSGTSLLTVPIVHYRSRVRRNRSDHR